MLRQLKAALETGSSSQGGYGSERHMLRELCLAPLQAISTATATGRNAGGREGSAQEKQLALQCMCLLMAEAGDGAQGQRQRRGSEPVVSREPPATDAAVTFPIRQENAPFGLHQRPIH